MAEEKLAKQKKTPEEKAIAKRERAKARRLKKRAVELGVAPEELLEKRSEKTKTLEEVLESV